MTPSIEAFRALARSKRVAVIGIGISNRPLIVWLHKLGIQVDAFDCLPADDPYFVRSKAWLADQGVLPNFHLGDNYLDDLIGFDLIFRTPRLQPDDPALQKAKLAGSIVTSEMELFLTLCPAPVIAVTGSDGKTTTTTLIATMLEREGYHTYLGGNIGRPLLDRVFAMDQEDRVVVELSSFQLVSMTQRIETAVITNITPNHLDVHPSFEAYVDAKKNIFRHQTLFDRLVLNAADDTSKSFLNDVACRVDLVNHQGAWPGQSIRLDSGRLILTDKKGSHDLLSADEILLPGPFNLQNVMTAALAVWPDVGAATIRQVATTFKGVAHRLELIDEKDGVSWYNSSIDSTPLRSMATLNVFSTSSRPLILITGGADKNSDYDRLGNAILEATNRIILCGDNADLIKAVLAKEADGRHYTILELDSYADAVKTAASMAKKGDSVLLSPAGTSFDKFRHFEERGNHFRDLVHAL